MDQNARCKGRNKSYIEVLGVDFIMLGEIEILFCDKHTLWQSKLVIVLLELSGSCASTAEEVLVDLLSVGLWDKPECGSAFSNFYKYAAKWLR